MNLDIIVIILVILIILVINITTTLVKKYWHIKTQEKNTFYLKFGLYRK